MIQTHSVEIEILNQRILSCRICPRLVAWREQVALEKRRAFKDQVYWGKPVPGFGDLNARIFTVGLAPGAHGSNRTGRQFTGDGSGDFLFPALHRAGLANQPFSRDVSDGMLLQDVYTAPVCRCAPPDNKPTSQEMQNCLPYLEAELAILHPRVLVALGRIAYDIILKIFGVQKTAWKFGHGLEYTLDDQTCLLCSYHPSRQNTQTGRLTSEMFDSIWKRAKELAGMDG